MELSLVLKNSNETTTQDKAEIDEFVKNAIELHKGNSLAINKLVMDSVTALTVSEARAGELETQGFFKRSWNNLAGKNQKITASIDRNLAEAQYASQQVLQKLAEQNLLAFDTITAANNKLNTLMVEVDEEINNIYKTLMAFFKQTRADIIQMEARIEKLERNVELLHWNSTIEYQVYDGADYCELSDIEKIVCIANDFYHLTKGRWSTADLLLLKSTLSAIGLQVNSKLSSKGFYKYLIEKPKLIDRLFKDISLDEMINVKEYQAPLLKGVYKLKRLQGEEKYILDTVVEQLDLATVRYNKRDIQISMVKNYLRNTAFMNVDINVNMFDFVVELLINISMINDSAATIQIEEDIEEKPQELLYNEETRNERGNTTGNIINKGYVASQGNWIFYRNSGDGNKLYKVRKDGSKKTKICDDNVLYINVVGEWIYYTNLDNGKVIYKIKLDGTERTKLIDDASREISVFDGWIYYISKDDGSKAYRIKTDGTNKQQLTKKRTICLNVVNNWIYFIYEADESDPLKMKLCKMNINYNDEIEILKEIKFPPLFPHKFSRYFGYLQSYKLILDKDEYYYTSGDVIYRKNNRCISDVFRNCMTVDNGEIYYAKQLDNRMIIKNNSGKEVMTIDNVHADDNHKPSINIIDDRIYVELNGIIYKAKKE